MEGGRWMRSARRVREFRLGIVEISQYDALDGGS
ncbi:uncharacterized protein RAG0_01727 [Rhynchosporium agropyri]|uniref:Uncharacterized protein n=1 Tax=Rhynchosporium agropyri TaxID=914238 RepID=A0A1E1JY62_9HELO|nr:uncharacterized protein RAG0_01727 [Rhynchosporium agropyri]